MSSSNITFNGKPLEEHLSEETGREIAAVRNENVALKGAIHVPQMTRTVRNHSRARTSPGVVVYQAGQRETHVIIAGNLFAWQDKAPYVRSGHSVLGALEHDAKTDTVKCHQCGEWFRSIGHHIFNQAKGGSSTHTTVRAYRIRHGFRIKSSISTPSSKVLRKQIFNPAVMNHRLRASDIARGHKVKSLTSSERRSFDVDPHSEAANVIGRCRAQRIVKLQAFAAQLGRTPLQRELTAFRENGSNPLCPASLRQLFRVCISKIFIQAGLVPRPKGLKLDGTYGRKNITPRPKGQNVGTRSDLIAVPTLASGSTCLQNTR